MDQKTWLWRKKSSEKTILASLEEARPVTSEKEVDLENSLKTLNEELASVVDESSAKDELVHAYKKAAEDALLDKEKAEEEIRGLKEVLDETQQQKTAANERLANLNSALKDCMDQLSAVRQEQDQIVHNTVMKTSKEFEKSHKKLEEELSETSAKLASLTAENSYLSKALLVKEKLIVDLNNIKTQTEAELKVLMTRLDSVEKENAFLRYEFMSLEKELVLRNEELEYNRRSVDASNKQHLESVKKIKKLEAECQRLRALTRKRLPGPGILSHVEVPGGNQSNINRRKVVNGDSVVQDSSMVYSPDHTNRQLSFLIDQLHDLQNENKIFKECLNRKEEEIFHLRKAKDLAIQEKPELTLSNDVASSDDQKTESECRMIASEMSLMDDFVEMEKLAIVAVDSSIGASLDSSDISSRELVPVWQGDNSVKKPDDWLHVVRSMILEQHSVSKRSLDELLGDVRASLHDTSKFQQSELLPISGYLTWKSPTSSPSSSLNQESCTDVNRSISRMIELVRRFDSPRSEDHNMKGGLLDNEKFSYKVHIFRWKRSELTSVLQEFVRCCNNLLEGKIDSEKFTGDLVSVLGWIMDKTISYQDHSAVRDEFRKHLGGDGPGTALELESVQNLMLEMEKMHSVLQVEIKGLKSELDKALDATLQSGRQNNEALMHKLQKEMEILKESKGKTEDQFANLKLINEDLDTQLAVTKAKLNKLIKKLSSVEVELDNKSHHCEELEGACLELQLQLESFASNRYSGSNNDQQGLLQTGMEITKASAKLAECEETILKLGKQLKTLGSAKDKKLKPRSLLDQMLCEDNPELSHPDSPKTKEIISTSEAKALVPAGSFLAFSFPDGQVATPTPYLGTKNETRNARAGPLVIVPTKKRGGGVGLLRKLLLRKKKATSIYYGK